VPIIAAVRPRAPGPREPEALFVGHFDHAPNIDGLRWLVEHVWPGVVAERPEARLTVIGTRATDEVRGFGSRPGVRVLGYVPDVAPFLQRARLSVAPLRYGAGMKGKVVEAMAWGVPVVTTSVGAQGLGLTPGEHALVADEAAPFAAALAGLLGDAWRAEQIGLAGQRHVARLCAPEVVGPPLHRFLDEVLHRPPRPATVPPAAALVQWLRRCRLAGRHAAVSTVRRQAQWLLHRA
jgi:glycosyltransferase involved in cell wall biosynthesis